MNILMFFLLTFFMATMLMIISHLMPVRNLEQNKNTPYECGFDPIKSTRLPFSFRFFLMAILFLMFDLEMALLLPMIKSTNNNMYLLSNFSSMFMMILALGLYYEWNQGGLEWAS